MLVNLVADKVNYNYMHKLWHLFVPLLYCFKHYNMSNDIFIVYKFVYQLLNHYSVTDKWLLFFKFYVTKFYRIVFK